MRLFFALLLPPDVVDGVRAAQERLRGEAGDDGIRWTRPEQFHFTLKFLGEQTLPRAQRAVDSVADLCKASRAFRLAIGGVGAFPDARRPSVLWAGTTAGGEALVDLAGALDARLATAGFPRERRQVKAHLTLARIKGYAGEIGAARAIRRFENAEEMRDLGAVTVNRVVLMQSTLDPKGAEYRVVEEFALAGEGGVGS